MSIEQKTAIITGGAGGIGFAIVEQLLAVGYFVYALDNNENSIIKAEKRLYKYDNKVRFYNINLSSEQEIIGFLSDLKKNNIIITILVNCVGYQEEVRIFKLTLDQWRKLFKVNVESAFLLSKVVAKLMINNKIQGSIINITSIHSSIIRDIVHYSSSKAALEQLTRELAYSLAKYNIRVNAIAPGSIDTPLIRKELNSRVKREKAARMVPLQRLGSPYDVASVVEFLCSDKSKYITGTTIIVDGGLSLVI